MAEAGARSPLQEVLRLLLPGARARPVLDAVLCAGDVQLAGLRAACASRDHGLGNSPLARYAARGLRPLLHHAVVARQFPCDPALLTLLRTAWVREEARANTLAQAARPVLAALTEAGVDFVLLKGVPLAWSAYPEPALRHCHDLDVLVRTEAVPAAVAAATAAGFGPADGGSRAPGAICLVHRRGLPLEFHCTPIAEPYYSLPLDDLWRRCVELEIWGLGVRVLAPEDQLLQVLGLAAATPQRHSLHWVCDGRFLRTAAPTFDWDRFLATCGQARLDAPVSVMLRYLAEEAGVAVPTVVLNTLDTRVRNASPLARDIALAGARAGKDGRLLLVAGVQTGWTVRARALGWLLFPSPEYLRHTNQTGNARRAGRYLAGAARDLARRLVPPRPRRAVPL